MVKKALHKLFFVLLIFINFYNFSFASSCEGGCNIKDGPAEVLKEYISNNRKIISNISSQLGSIKSSKSFATGVSLRGTDIETRDKYNTSVGLRIYNSLFNWQEVEAGFKGFLAGIDGETPEPIARDFRMLENQNEAFNVFLDRIISNGHYDNTEIFTEKNIDKICKGIKAEKCSSVLVGKSLEDVMVALIRNNNKIALILRKELGIMGMKSVIGSDDYNSLFLVSDNFREEIIKNYNKSTYGACARCNGGSLYKIDKAIKKITQNDKDGKKGIDEWKEAWDLLLEIGDGEDDSTKYQSEERELLNEELSEKGINSKNGESVLKGLKDFNNDGLNSKNNPIKNSFRAFQEQFDTPLTRRTKKELNEVWANISEESDDVVKSVSLGEISVVKKKLEETNDIQIKIDSIIKETEPILNRQNLKSDELQARIIQMHINLIQTVEELDKTIPKSEKVCKSQDSSNAAKCSFRKK